MARSLGAGHAFAADSPIAIECAPDALTLRGAANTTRVARLDAPGRGTIARTPPKPVRQADGRTADTDRPLIAETEQRKTWAFSAHMAPRKKD